LIAPKLALSTIQTKPANDREDKRDNFKPATFPELAGGIADREGGRASGSFPGGDAGKIAAEYVQANSRRRKTGAGPQRTLAPVFRFPGRARHPL